MFIKIFPVWVTSDLFISDIRYYENGIFINLHNLIYFRELDLKGFGTLDGRGVELPMNTGSGALSYFIKGSVASFISDYGLEVLEKKERPVVQTRILRTEVER